MIKKLLSYYSFIIVAVIVFMTFVSAQSIGGLLVAIALYPMFAYSFLSILPRRRKAIAIPIEAGTPPDLEEDEEVVKLKKEGLDIDRRAFLKVAGSAGVSMLLFTIFTRRAEGAFFGSVPGPGTVALKDSSGTQIDPAEKHPTDGYEVNEVDDSTIPSFFGFINKTGNWYIIKEDPTGTFRYKNGGTDTDFPTNWTGRAGLTYGYFGDEF